jgi:hypothetical protein
VIKEMTFKELFMLCEVGEYGVFNVFKRLYSAFDKTLSVGESFAADVVVAEKGSPVRLLLGYHCIISN